MEQIVVRVKYKDDIKFIAVPANDLNPSSFACRAARAFNVIVKQGDKIRYCDNLDTPISESLFSSVINTFHRGSSFFVNIAFETADCTRPLIITASALKLYFEQKDQKELLIDCENTSKLKQALSDTQKCKCVNLIADYGIDVFGKNINIHQIKQLALAAVSLIDGLKSETGEPTDILINNTVSGTGGRLYNRIRYLKTKIKPPQTQQNSTAPPTMQNVNSQYSMNDLLWLKTALVTDANIDEIRSKLELTRRRRDEMVLSETIELLQEFPFFYTHPLLILDDFDLKCKANKIEINSNAFLEIWPEMSQKLDRILKKYHICQAFDTEWSNEIKTFLISIRLLPFKPGARSVASVETFQNSVKRLLVFSNTSQSLITQMEIHHNTQPFIVAKGESKGSINEYSIVVDNNEICLPIEFSFAQVIDMYFKMHHIFEIKFDERLQNAMFFLKHYIYKLKEGTRKPTTKLIELYNHLASIDSSLETNNEIV